MWFNVKDNNLINFLLKFFLNLCKLTHVHSPAAKNNIVDFVNVFWRHSWYWSSRTWCVFVGCSASLRFIHPMSPCFQRKNMSCLIVGAIMFWIFFAVFASMKKKLNRPTNVNFGHIKLKLGLKVTSIRFNCQHFRESTILDGKLPKSFWIIFVTS